MTLKCAAPRCEKDAAVIRMGNSLCGDDKDHWLQVTMQLYDMITVEDMEQLAGSMGHLFGPFVELGARLAREDPPLPPDPPSGQPRPPETGSPSPPEELDGA